MNLLGLLFATSKMVVVVALFAGVISGAAAAALIAVINSMLTGEPGGAGLFAALCGVVLVSRFGAETLLGLLSHRAVFAMRMRLSQAILSAPLAQLEGLGRAPLYVALTQDVAAITNGVAGIPVIFSNLAILVSCFVYLGWLYPAGLLGVLAFLVLGLISYQLPVSRAMRFLRRARDEEDRLFERLRDLTEGVKELKLHRARREAFMSTGLAPVAAAFCRLNVVGTAIYSAAASWGYLLFFVLVGLLLLIPAGAAGMSGKVLTGFVVTILYAAGPLGQIMDLLPLLGRAVVAARKVQEVGLSLAPARATSTPERAGELPSRLYRLDLVDVVHAYSSEDDEGGFTVGPLSLSVQPGDLIFITGGNGSGKTTLAKILTGLYSPQSGEIRVNGVVVTDATRDAYRQLFSAVFADYHVFDRLLGLSYQREHVTEYLDRLRLADKVTVTNGAFSTTSLSQGQRRRLALLTAYLEDRPVYLFDEWAADQDPAFRDLFYTRLLPELKATKKAVVVVTHDDRYFAIADRLIRLECGKVTGEH